MDTMAGHAGAGDLAVGRCGGVHIFRVRSFIERVGRFGKRRSQLLPRLLGAARWVVLFEHGRELDDLARVPLNGVPGSRVSLQLVIDYLVERGRAARELDHDLADARSLPGLGFVWLSWPAARCAEGGRSTRACRIRIHSCFVRRLAATGQKEWHGTHCDSGQQRPE
jgi:hypothetical protein